VPVHVDERQQHLEEAIRERLRNICKDFPDDDFESLVVQIARNARRAELRNAEWGNSLTEDRLQSEG
jgi:hypothetical protein